ncbi:MAG: TrkA C-terminal domain-containing protein [Turicibacter sp.]
MSFVGSFLLFICFISVYLMIIEIFTVLFRLTGLTEEKAKFQVISLLTNSGFTTQESEIITGSKVRRQLARATMLFGYSFTVTIVSSVVNVFMELKNIELTNMLFVCIALLIFISLIYLIRKNIWVKQRFDRFIENIGNRLMFGEKSNPLLLMDQYHSMAMVEVNLKNVPPCFKNRKLSDSNFRVKYNILILIIIRDGKVIQNVLGSTVLQQDDILVVFGPYKNIRELFERPECDS